MLKALFVSYAIAVLSPAAFGQAIAITVDDVPGRTSAGGCDRASTVEMNRMLLDALDNAGIVATGLVTPGILCRTIGDSLLVDILEMWLDRGHTLGNHTFSHPDLNSTSIEDFRRDVIRADSVIRPVVESRGGSLRYFRYPMLHTGDTRSKRAAGADLLSDLGYVNAPVTIDSQEWVFANAFRREMAAGRGNLARCIGRGYVAFMDSVLSFFELRSVEILDRNPAHILLLHANQLNAYYLPELLDMIARRGYRFVRLDDALEDPAYREDDGFVSRRGLSSIHRWGLSRGLDVIEEPRDPGWLQDPQTHCSNETP